MNVNLYDSIEMLGSESVEKPLGETVGHTIYGWGDALLKPINGSLGGRCYRVHLNGSIDNFKGYGDKDPLSFIENVRAFAGYYLKKVGIWLCPEIKLDHVSARAGNASHFRFKNNVSLSSGKQIRIYPEGRGSGADVLGDCCVGCCQFIVVICQMINKH